MYRRFRDIAITKGAKRDVLVDFSRNVIKIIPKEVTGFLESIELDGNVISMSKDEHSLLDDLLREEIVFQLDEDEYQLYSDLNETWDYPALISNAIVEIGRDNFSLLPKIFEELQALNCFDLSLIISETLALEEYEQLISLFENSTILSIELSTNYYADSFFAKFVETCLRSRKLSGKMTMFNCSDTGFQDTHLKEIRFIDQSYNKTGCGYIKKENFRANMPLFMESKYHNTCLNRKVTIDKNGDIYNCWNIGKCFGNIATKSIIEVLNIPEFKKHWHIRKEDINICKDCEFRNICTDCRAFLNDPADIYSKPLKCGYDPYTNIWEDWSLNPLKQKIMDYYTKSNSL